MTSGWACRLVGRFAALAAVSSAGGHVEQAVAVRRALERAGVLLDGLRDVRGRLRAVVPGSALR